MGPNDGKYINIFHPAPLQTEVPWTFSVFIKWAGGDSCLFRLHFPTRLVGQFNYPPPRFIPLWQPYSFFNSVVRCRLLQPL